MKVAELLTEAKRALILSVMGRIVKELDGMAEEYRKGIAELGGLTLDEVPVPFTSKMLLSYGTGVQLERNDNITDTMWEEIFDEVNHMLKEEGYMDGVLPVSVQTVREPDHIWILVS